MKHSNIKLSTSEKKSKEVEEKDEKKNKITEE